MKGKKLLLILIIHLMCMVCFTQIPIQPPNSKTDVIKKPPPLSNFNYGVIPQTANCYEYYGDSYTYATGACQQISGNAWVYLFTSMWGENQAFRFDANQTSISIINQVNFASTWATNTNSPNNSNKHKVTDMDKIISNYTVANIIQSGMATYFLFGEDKNGKPHIVSYNPHPAVGFDTQPLGTTYSLTTPILIPTKMKAVTFNNKIYLFGGFTNGVFSNTIYEFKPSASGAGKKFVNVGTLPGNNNTKIQVAVGKDSGVSKIFILKNGNEFMSWIPSSTSISPTSLGNISTPLKDEIITFSRVNTSAYISASNPDQFIKEYPHILGDGANGTGAIPLKSFFYRGANDWKEIDNKLTTTNQTFSTKDMFAIRCGKPTFLITPTSINKMIAP